MERIAVISDIHANVVALEAVLEDIKRRKIDRIFCLGDLVMKGASPCEVVDIIREKCEIVVKAPRSPPAPKGSPPTPQKAYSWR